MAADGLEALVGLGVDARDEEGGDGRDAARVAAAVDEALDAAHVRLGDLAVALEREDQRDVDRDAVRDRVLDRLQALERGGDLDQQVRAVDELEEPHGLGLGLLGVVREVRVNLERDPAVLALALVPDGTEDVAGVADVVLGELPEDLLGVVVLAAQLADLVVVGVAFGDRALEDGRALGLRVARDRHDLPGGDTSSSRSARTSSRPRRRTSTATSAPRATRSASTRSKTDEFDFTTFEQIPTPTKRDAVVDSNKGTINNARLWDPNVIQRHVLDAAEPADLLPDR